MLRRFWIALFAVARYPSIMDGVGKALGYLCLLILLVTLVYGARTHDDIRGFLGIVSGNIRDWPDFELSGGRFTFEGAMPYIVGDRSNTLIIDTEGEAGREAFAMAGDAILITRDQIIIKNDGRETAPLNWSDLPISFSRDTLAGSLGGWLWPALIAWGLAVLVFGIAAKCLSALLLSLAGLLAAQGVGFGRIYAASIYALTGPIALSVAKNHFYPAMPFFAVLYWGWALVYVIVAARIAVREIKAAAPPPADAFPPVIGAG